MLKLKKQNTAKKDDDPKTNASTRLVPQIPKGGVSTQGNGTKRKVGALKGCFGDTNKILNLPSPKCNNSLKASLDVQLDMDGIASEVFGLLIEKIKQNINILLPIVMLSS